MTILEPDLLWLDGRFVAGQAVLVDERTGRIAGVEAADRVTRADGDVAHKLTGRALLSGFVNTHSHAFQRLIRGRTQWRPAERADADFWSWRDAMYAAALTLSPDDIEAVSRQCFLEMLKAGITTVGEFHYLHRDADGRPYADPEELARRVIRAARDVGIRITLLDVCYAAGGIDAPLRDEQRRFATPDLDAFLGTVDALRAYFDADPNVDVGVAPHSVRAVPRDWLPEIAAWAADAGAPCHMHLSEQPAEIEASVAAWGLRPVEIAAEAGLLTGRFTAVHATHLEPGEVALLAGGGATVCACPTTERDLGDGFLPASELLSAGVPVALGSDSQTRIDPFEEMRLLESHERLRSLRRVVLAESSEASGGRLEVAPVLIRAATAGGARALGLDAGRIAAGALADLVAIDLEHPVLAGWTVDTLAASIALCAGAEVVTGVWVGGRARVTCGRHDDEASTLSAFRDVAGRIM